MCEKSWTQLREELKMLPRQMCVTPVGEALEYVDEILKLQEKLQSAQQEIERLQQLYEREREIADWILERVKNLREERNQDRQWIEKASENVTRLQQERDKLIGALRWYADTKNYEYRTSYLDQDAPIIDDCGQRARDILKEMGVVEWQKSVNDM